MQRLEFRAMGCQMLAVVDADTPTAVEALDQVPVWFEEWESSLSRFRSDSELSQLNRSTGQPFHASDTLWNVFRMALEAARASDGLVTPAVLQALEAAGYDRDFNLLGPSTKPLGLPGVGDWRLIQYDKQARTITLPVGMRLDFGGTAKGWAADAALGRLSGLGPALVDAGGDIAVSGPMVGGDPWPVAVADPSEPERDLAMLLLGEGAVATSGRDYRRWKRDGVEQHHIIDPRTGRPAETDVLAATIIAPSAREAEIAAKVALILGSRAGLEWVQAREEYAGLFVLESGRVLKTRRFEDYVWSESLHLTV